MSRQEFGHIVEKDFRDNFLSSRIFENEFTAVHRASPYCDRHCKVDCWVTLKNGALLGLQITIAADRARQEEKIKQVAFQPIVHEHDERGKVTKAGIPKVVIFVNNTDSSRWKKENVLKNIKECLIFEERLVGSDKDRQLIKNYRQYFNF